MINNTQELPVMIKDRLKIQNTKKILFLLFYYILARHLPESYSFIFGRFSKQIRYFCCKNIFFHCGHNVNIERKASFGCGFDVEIGDNSGIGIKCVVPSDIKIGNDVMMGPEVYILHKNHNFQRLDIPMMIQGDQANKTTTIEDDVWIGRQVIFTPGRLVKKGTIIAAGTVLCKDFEEYSIVGGNPSKFIRSRKG